MLPIRTLFFMTIAISTVSIAENHLHNSHHHQEQEEDCPICMEVPSSQEMMCENGHSMGCVSCVEAIAAQAAQRGIQPECPMCRKTFNLEHVKAEAARKAQGERVVEQVPQIQPIVDREALIRQIIEQERQNLLAELGEDGLRQIRAEHLDALHTEVRREVRCNFTKLDRFAREELERQAMIDEIRVEVRRQLMAEERQKHLDELGEAGLKKIKAEHSAAIRQEVRDNFTEHEVRAEQENERNAIIREVRAELRRQKEASIRQEQRNLAEKGELILIDAKEKTRIETDELHHMQDEERNRIRRAHHNHIIRDQVQLISDIEREAIMQAVFNQMQQAEIARKIQVTNTRRQSIERNFYLKNGLIWLRNCIPFWNIAYYNYLEDVDAQLRLEEAQNPA